MGNETGRGRRGHCCCCLAWHLGGVCFLSSADGLRKSELAGLLNKSHRSSNCFAQWAKLSALGNILLSGIIQMHCIIWDFIQHGSHQTELPHHVIFDCGKTAGFAFLKINLQQISFDYGLNLQSCSFLNLLPRLKLQREIQYDCATLSTFQLSNASEDI